MKKKNLIKIREDARVSGYESTLTCMAYAIMFVNVIHEKILKSVTKECLENPKARLF